MIGLAIAFPIYGFVIPLIFSISVTLTTIPYGIELIVSGVIQGSNSQDTIREAKNKLVNWFDHVTLLVMVASAGALGSVVSILIRLDEYRDTDYKGSAIPIFVGFAKPLIGTSFGILIFTMISSNIISFPSLQRLDLEPTTNTTNPKNTTNNNDARYFFFFTLAFLVGFSERLANDIVQRAEGSIFPNAKKDIAETKKVVLDAAHVVEKAAENTVHVVEQAAEEIKDEINSSNK